MTSCSNATIAPTAIFHSKRKLMYSMIAASTTIRPLSAFFEISLPHVGPTSCWLMSPLSIPACSARAVRSASDLLPVRR